MRRVISNCAEVELDFYTKLHNVKPLLVLVGDVSDNLQFMNNFENVAPDDYFAVVVGETTKLDNDLRNSVVFVFEDGKPLVIGSSWKKIVFLTDRFEEKEFENFDFKYDVIRSTAVDVDYFKKRTDRRAKENKLL